MSTKSEDVGSTLAPMELGSIMRIYMWPGVNTSKCIFYLYILVYGAGPEE